MAPWDTDLIVHGIKGGMRVGAVRPAPDVRRSGMRAPATAAAAAAAAALPLRTDGLGDVWMLKAEIALEVAHELQPAAFHQACQVVNVATRLS